MSDQTFRDIEQKILDASNFGLDIIQSIYPQANDKKNFRIREDDKTASTSMKLLDVSGVRAYRVTDFGGNISSENCFGLYALDKNISYTEAVLELANEYQAKGHQILETQKIIYKPDYREYHPDDFPHELNDKGFHFITKDFNSFELGLLGPEIKNNSAENEYGNHRSSLVTVVDCKEVNLHSLEEYSFLTKEKDKVITYRSTDKFPILAFINDDEEIGQWLKIYKPRAGKKFTEDGKDYRFHHLGGRPRKFIFGLSRLKKLLEEYKKSKEKEFEILYGSDAEKELEKLKLPHICIATGGSDGLNLIALGIPVIWFNSETEKIDRYIINDLLKYADEIINIPDCDTTGKREGRDLALQFMEVRTLWLDDYFKNPRNKDFKDFCKENQSYTRSNLTKKVNQILGATKPAKFWSSSYNENTKRYTHNFSPTFAFYFLRLNGFCRVLDKSKKDGYYFAKVYGNVVEEVNITDIRNYFKNFLIQKQNKEGVREVSHSLMDSLITTTKLSESSMSMLHDRELDFTDFDRDAQYFFIGNKVYKTTKKGTEESSFNRYVLKSQLLDELIYDQTAIRIDATKFKISENSFFTIKEIGPRNYSIEIHNEKCDLLNYMIQTSRVHWRKELAEYKKTGKKEEDFYKDLKFKITSKYLDEIENQEQVNHLVNKIWTYGYMLHRYKDPTKSWSPFAVDNAVLEDNVAEGGAGKTMYFKSLSYFCNFFEIPKSEDKDDKFKFEGITEHTDFVYFDDVDRLFDLRVFFSEITGGMTVNVKNVSRAKLSHSVSPKFGFSSNYAIRHNEGSYDRRRILLGFSDYYHAENKDTDEPSYEPVFDFGHRIFDDWQDADWFSNINFGFQTLSFYLDYSSKIEAPSNNILLRTYYSEMGAQFQEWADGYLPSIIGEKLVKDEVLEICRNSGSKYLKEIKSASFKKKLNAWCKVNDFIFEDRIMENVPQYNNGQAIIKDGKHYYKTTEHIRLHQNVDDNERVEEREYY